MSVYFTDQPKGSFHFHIHFSYNWTLFITIYMYIGYSFNKLFLSKIAISNFIEMLFEIANLIFQWNAIW